MKVFAEQHELFRASLRAFLDKEIAPHVEAWEEAGRLPRWIWPRMGALGFLGVEYDERYGGAGADLPTTMVLHEECARIRSGSFAMAVGVHTDMASPHLYWTGSEALKERYLPAICRAANRRQRTLTFASSFSSNDRGSKLADPTETKQSSTISTLQWYIVGW